MAKLSKKKEAVIAEETVEEVVQEARIETVTSDEDVLTHDEVEAIQKAREEEETESADTTRLQLATDLVSKKFNLDPSYSVKKFDDKGKVVNLALENKDFILNVTIKDSDKHGMYVE